MSTCLDVAAMILFISISIPTGEALRLKENSKGFPYKIRNTSDNEDVMRERCLLKSDG